jgi:small-conductance mechanosensitive channel
MRPAGGLESGDVMRMTEMLNVLKSCRAVAAAVAGCFAGAISLAHAAAVPETPGHAAVEPGSSFLGGATGMIVATLVLFVALWLVRWTRLWILTKLERLSSLPGGFPPAVVSDLRSYMLPAAQKLARLVATVVSLALIYLWFVYSLNQFDYTASWGERSADFLVNLLLGFATGAMLAVPGLVAVIIIVLIARWVVRLINVIFKEVQAGKLSFSWLERETARTTQILLIAVVWLFALVVAYPYIPGSETDAFKGLSVLIGLMITLGSTGLINQVISGFFVIYSRSVRPVDYVRVGDIEGEVIEVGFLATKLKTPRQEEITIPHSVLVGTATTNYSRLAGPDGMVLTASVTIGYDVPWRQVHALILLGASRPRACASSRRRGSCSASCPISLCNTKCWRIWRREGIAPPCCLHCTRRSRTRSMSMARKSWRRTSNPSPISASLFPRRNGTQLLPYRPFRQRRSLKLIARMQR